MWERINRKKWAASLAVLLAIVGGSYYYYQSAKSQKAAAVESVAVTKGTIVSSVSATGTVKPIDAVDISSQITALIKEIKVKENDYVKAGQTLVILDDKALETTLQEAQYTVNSTAAKYKRAKYLNSIGAKSDADFEDTLLNYQNAKAAYDQAQSNLDKTVLVSPMDGVVLGQPVSVGTLVTAGVNDPTVIMMIGDVSQKKVKVKVDETDIGKIKVGQQATFTVDAYQNHTFTGNVIQIGQISTNTTSVSSTSTSSSSTSSSTASSSTSSVIYYYVTLSVDDPDNLLKTEMTARVNIKVGEKDDALLIPLAALKTSTNGQYVMVLGANGVTENVPVTVGLTSNDKVEIISGLEEGDQLVISYTKSENQSSSKQKDNGPPPM
ncbi:HlyD family secretion protein/macrolide-specific efflux system membrane fusion protein [Sporomusaceae bacterium BoRhaA]|uniref:efflux RND transporter periplasmic adaptor subunit n=1 Tax=Pelorhabdus rhamnosifermentans TaxID=2772457 RepID=UPI001C0624B0|nr:efflux RND transporter periplasmic adaptor subunit [Pelorhabdus rhamnosifermentans]MBU2699545.1 HlyD family secretion protein/macrolide-specific efflux system membrane fusion protein [Pelorhabdus rhamnosifermentans]